MSRVPRTLPETIAELRQALEEIEDPVRRARVAGMLVDAHTRQVVGHVRAAAVHEATRTLSRSEVAALLGTGVTAVGKLVSEHNGRARADAGTP